MAWEVIEQNHTVYRQQHTDCTLEVLDSGFVIVSLGSRRRLHGIDDLASGSEQIVGGAHDFTDRGTREELRRP